MDYTVLPFPRRYIGVFIFFPGLSRPSCNVETRIIYCMYSKRIVFGHEKEQILRARHVLYQASVVCAIHLYVYYKTDVIHTRTTPPTLASCVQIVIAWLHTHAHTHTLAPGRLLNVHVTLVYGILSSVYMAQSIGRVLRGL